jgi:uncharacterized Zn finger protein
MKCDKCGSENTKVTQKSDKGYLTFVIRCLDCGDDRLPTPQERSEFNK